MYTLKLRRPQKKMRRQLLVWFMTTALAALFLIYVDAQKAITVELKNGQGESVGTARRGA